MVCAVNSRWPYGIAKSAPAARSSDGPRCVASEGSEPELANMGAAKYNRRWGGWDSNPRLTDYENSGPMHHALCKHR
jgi:hypothetical protein